MTFELSEPSSLEDQPPHHPSYLKTAATEGSFTGPGSRDVRVGNAMIHTLVGLPDYSHGIRCRESRRVDGVRVLWGADSRVLGGVARVQPEEGHFSIRLYSGAQGHLQEL